MITKLNMLGTLNIIPVASSINSIANPVASFLESQSTMADEIGVAEIDPNFSDTAAFCDHYKVSLDQTVNCVIIKASRGDKDWYAACLILGSKRADVNGLIRRHLGARKASFAPMDETVALTHMEYGGITPVGLPADWPILIDKAVAESSEVVIGSGVRGSKLVISGKFLMSLPNAVVLEGMSVAKID